MKWIGIAGVIVAICTSHAAAWAQSSPASPKAGEEYELSKSYETRNKGSDGSSGSSRGRDGLLERILDVSEAGIEAEYDLPKDVTTENRASYWQFPARVLKTPDGSMRLLNPEELEARVDPWLKAANWTRAVCGRMIFTWNAFRIECDPQAVIETIMAFDLDTPVVVEGAPYQEDMARTPGTLTKKAARPDGETFTAEMEINPDAVHRSRAETDVLVGEIIGTAVTFEDALGKRSQEKVSGTIRVLLETDSVGRTWRKTTTSKLMTTRPDGVSEEDESTETVERRRIH
ncbi:MAG TPA: hypothetical protein PKD99_02130 [Sphingopyxis sp.]|nr:hypothetical protein [Sphingopyxis sp.]HMP43875.1 hypothetical protein [Sphingopyxis sp.]HMQ19078.1 hypothetical protein [Sphingopyxis sp.]